MALGVTFRSRVSSATNSTSYVTNSGAFIPGASSLMLALLAFNSGSSDGPVASADVVTGNGATYANVFGITQGGASDNGGVFRCELWVANAGGSPSNGEITVGFTTQRLGCHIAVVEVTGWDTTLGSTGAILNQRTTSGIGTSLNLAAFADASTAGNRTFGLVGHDQSGTLGSTSLPTGLSSGGYNTPLLHYRTMWRSDAFSTQVQATMQNSSISALIGFEVAVAAAGGAPPAAIPRLRTLVGIGV